MKHSAAWVFPFVTACTLGFMVLHPQDTLDAALQGFLLWGKVVLPSLFPFLIAANLLFASGLVNRLEMLLKPVMQPLFHLPGCAALPVFMGFTSGFPVGAILTRRLYDEHRIRLTEAEHLLAFTNNSSPLFILGTIGAGLFHAPALGLLLLCVHNGSNLLVGLLLRFTHPCPEKQPSRPSANEPADAASIGTRLSDAIRNAFSSTTLIAGFIVIFSVLTRMLSVWGIIGYLSRPLTPVLELLHLPPETAEGFLHGLFEMTIGCQATAESTADPYSQLLLISLLLAFSGLSILAQIMSIMASVPIRWSRFFLARGLQMLFSVCLLRIFAPFFLALPVFFSTPLAEPFASFLYTFDVWTISLLFLLFSLLFLLLVLLCATRKKTS